MLYFLYSHLGLNILQYISFRAGLAFIFSFVFCILAMPRFIAWAREKNAAQPISLYIPSHQIKRNTPTMGGLVFVAASVLSSLLCANLFNFYVLFALLVLVVFCGIGVCDDYVKIAQNANRGISAKRKLALLVFASSLAAAALYFIGHNSFLYLPFIKTPILNLGYFAVLFWSVVFIATSNAVNITDGLDGLATVPSICAIATLGVFIYISGHAALSSYLLTPKITFSGEVFIVSSALLGALFGFLWYNCHPAEIFMGDSGSLALGGFIAYMAIVSNNEILLFLIGLIFVVETLSVILQISSFKLRKKRIFKMAPIHHHFEVKGWSENKIIIRFWIIAILANLIALLSIKIR